MKIPNFSVPIIEIPLEKDIQLFIKREDLIHPEISGNKFWKLFYNIQNYQNKNVKNPLLITFGGAFSNHIAAVAKLGNLENLPTLGIIRGEELQNNWQENPTLKLANENGMQFRFVNRELYRNKENLIKILQEEFPESCIIPEGGSNDLAVKGIQMMLNEDTKQFDYLCSAVGTGGTFAGICKFKTENQKALGFSVVNDDELSKRIENWCGTNDFELIEASFGGYGKINEDNIRFINEFWKKHKIPLDAIYTGKMMQILILFIEKDYFPKNSKILAFHTGGLQGNEGVNFQLNKKNKTILDFSK